jgi:hypothetical protein
MMKPETVCRLSSEQIARALEQHRPRLDALLADQRVEERERRMGAKWPWPRRATKS